MKKASPNAARISCTSEPTREQTVLRLLEDGSTAWTPVLALLEVDQPVIVEAGDRFIIRDSGRQMVVGGGTVLDPDPPRRRRDAFALGHDLDAALEAGPAAVASVMLNHRPARLAGRSRRLGPEEERPTGR